jgi:hypothetical protein
VLAVLDNCGCHHVKAVAAAFIAAGWVVLFYPANMTDELQVMDLVANGPLKQFMRHQRILSVLAYFHLYKRDVMNTLVGNQPVSVSVAL